MDNTDKNNDEQDKKEIINSTQLEKQNSSDPIAKEDASKDFIGDIIDKCK